MADLKWSKSRAEQWTSVMQDLNQDPLACAARDGDVEEVLRLLDGGYDPNIGAVLSGVTREMETNACQVSSFSGDELGETPLFEAASAGSVDVVAALLVKRADPDKMLDLIKGFNDVQWVKQADA